MHFNTHRNDESFGGSRTPSAIRAYLALVVVMLGVGCSGRQTGSFEVAHRPDLNLGGYRVFYMTPNDSVSGQSDQERREAAGLNNLASALEHELKTRHFQVTRNVNAPDIDAYITFGYRTKGERGVDYSHTPGQSFQHKGRTVTIPGHSSATPYAWEDQSITVEIYDWAELARAGYEVGRVRPSWRGRMEYRARGLDGLTRAEAEYMVLNLLADFPTPRVADASARHELYHRHERAELFQSLGARGPDSRALATHAPR